VYVYLYAWGRHQADGSGVTPMPWNYYMGAAHALDIPFFLDNLDKPGFFAEINYTEENRPGREALGTAVVSYVDNFIRTGTPAADDAPDWLAWSNNPGDGKYLELNADLLETQIAMATEAITTESAQQALESSEDPVLREQVRTVLTEFVVTCALISDDPATDCGTE
jgi:para-nitrobenzyl esterase